MRLRWFTGVQSNPAFVDELEARVRFSASDAVRLGDGLYGASSGNPSLPAWLGSLMLSFALAETATLPPSLRRPLQAVPV